TVTTAFFSYARTRNNAYAMFKDIDLTHIRQVAYRIQKQGVGGTIELRTDSVNGNLISTAAIAAGEVKDIKASWEEVTAPVTPQSGVKDIFLVFKSPGTGQQNLFHIDWLHFSPERL